MSEIIRFPAVDLLAVNRDQPAEVIPLPNALADELERLADAVREGAIVGAVIGALDANGDVISLHSGVNYMQRRTVITALEDAAILALIDAQDGE